MDNVIDINKKEVEKPTYIIVVRIGHNGSEQRTSFGFFDSIDEADKFRETIYNDSPYICDVVPFNNKELYGESL